MIKIDTVKGVISRVRNLKIKSLPLFAVALFALIAGACGGTDGPANSTTGSVDPNEVAAKVNGKDIRMEEVERAIKQQAQGQEGNLSQLELAAARLQVLQSLIEEEVMFQKAESEGTMPSEEEVNAAFNKQKTDSRLTSEEFDKQMSEAGHTEESVKRMIRRGLAIQKLTEKITGQIVSPNDSEVTVFYNNNPEAFKRKRGAQLAVIVINPRAANEDGQPRSEVELQQRLAEIGKRLNAGVDFASVARELSDDPESRLRGGDWRYFTEEEMAATFSKEFSDLVMTKLQNGQLIPQPIPFEGTYIIVKLQQKLEKDEDRTLETPGVKQEIIDFLINSRKQLLAASYQTVAMSDARIDNLLAKKVVANPNELSGSRPAPVKTEANTNANANANTEANANSSADSNVNTAANANSAANNGSADSNANSGN